MEGKEIFDSLSQRDYSGSEADKYAQTLQTIFFHCTMSGEMQEFYDILKKAESENKKLTVPDDVDEYSIDSVVLS